MVYCSLTHKELNLRGLFTIMRLESRRLHMKCVGGKVVKWQWQDACRTTVAQGDAT